MDFTFIGDDGRTIFLACFHQYYTAQNRLERPISEALIAKIETLFELCIHEGDKNGFNTNSILEIPSETGQTCFQLATSTSEKLTRYLLSRSIKINSIDVNLMIPEFKYPDLSAVMMAKGINPHIIGYVGSSEVENNLESFNSSETKQMLAQFPRSIHYSIEDIECSFHCPVDCQSKYKKFFYKEGSLVEMDDSKRIGKGGFGMVFQILFHGKLKAAKCVQVDQFKRSSLKFETKFDFEKNSSEYVTQLASAGSGILIPEAFIRQQNQLKNQNGKWIAQNYNIFIYPLYDCNLYELHTNFEGHFHEEILYDILNQCFTRKR